MALPKKDATETIRRHGVAIAYAAEVAWNLREWLRESTNDRTLQPVLQSFLPGIRARLELRLIDGHLSAVAAGLPDNDDLSAAALIAFLERMPLPGNTHLEIPRGKPPVEWGTLSRYRARRLASQLVDEKGATLFDTENDDDLDKIEAMDTSVLSTLWSAAEDNCNAMAEAIDDDRSVVECHVTLLQMAAIVNRSKRTLERLAGKPTSPLPAIEGGRGRASEWQWSGVRPILETEYGRSLPEAFPADRFVRS